ncbi:MAG: multi-sensor hybrid histidine kinase [Verrucomicrobia bacterium]|jgi:PAS domain S-box-containing protein|nr:multi-sensor hybrid histidine kinase [Verrucomicrobiota bacterium]
MGARLKILNVEDNPLDSELIVRALERGHLAAEIVRVETPETFAQKLKELVPDLVLADYALPRFSGPAALQAARAHSPDLPFIFVTGSLGEELAIETLKQGATDYVMKERLDRLVPAIQRAMLESSERKARREAELALRLSEELYRRLVENARDGIFTLTAGGQVSSVNNACETMSGWTREQCLGKTFVEFIHPDNLQPAKEWLQATLEGKNPPPVELQLRSNLGHGFVTLEVTSTALLDEGQITGILCIARDVTERRHLEEQLRQAQKMESIGQLAGGVAHDFNNLLTVIHGHAALLLGDADFNLKHHDALREIARASERAASLTRQLLAFSRKQPMQVREVDLNEVVSDITRMLQRVLGEPVTLHCEYSSRLPSVKADQSMLEQVIMNLAVNARDAMPKGGTLTLRTHKVVRSSLTSTNLTEGHDGQYVCLTAQDTGTGIPPELVSRIFEPFFTTKEPGKGTGLGLATVYGIVKQHGGWVDVQSSPGHGTAFTIYLPASSVPAAAKEEAKVASKMSGGTECILLVEDEVAVRNLCRRLMERLGYTVLEAETGVAAVEVWKKERDRIQLLLTDMVMPEGMTGHELAQILRQDKPHLPIVLSTGYSPETLGEESLLEDGIHFLSKPYTPSQLAEIIRRAMGKPI